MKNIILIGGIMELIFEDISHKIYKNSKDGMIYTMLNMSVYIGNRNRSFGLPEDWRLVRVEKEGNERNGRHMEASLDDLGGIYGYSITNGKMQRYIRIESGVVARDSVTDLEKRETFLAHDLHDDYQKFNPNFITMTLEEYLKTIPVFFSESGDSIDERSIDFDMIDNVHIKYLFEKEKEIKESISVKSK
jgi:hypothetical protein